MLKYYNPTTPSQRHRVSLNYSKMGVKRAEDVEMPASLLTGSKNKKRQGRSPQTGRITMRRRGGGAKRLSRVVDFKGKPAVVPGKVSDIIYDPNRNAHLALINYVDGDKRLVVATKNMKAGFPIDTEEGSAREGSRRALVEIPVGTQICNVELNPGKGGKFARAAGANCFLAGFDGDYAVIKMPSGETRKVLKICMATIGIVGNEDYRNIVWGKAGRLRNKGYRPRVLGKSMNPVDHPHGGGKAHQPIGMQQRQTPQGKPTHGVKTRNPRKITSRLIIKSRHYA